MKAASFRILILVMLSSFSSLAQAADEGDWKPVSAAPDAKYKLFLNAKTFQREDDVVNASIRYAYATTQVFPFLNVKYDRMERRFAFQCKDRKVVSLDNNYYLGEAKVHSVNLAGGNPFQPQGQNLVPQKVDAGTLEDEALSQACAFSSAKK